MRVVLVLGWLVVFAAHPAAADLVPYRPLASPPATLLPVIPPHPDEPCIIDVGAVDCRPAIEWVGGPLFSTVIDYPGQLEPDSLVEWAALIVKDQFTFNDPGGGVTQATVHVHDSVAHDHAVFVVKGGPGGERWICKHACTVPDTGFTVSIDPLDVPPNVWIGFDAFPLPNLPATTGTITVTHLP